MTFVEVVHPFTPTVLLQEHLKKYPREYGSSRREHLPWKNDTIGWQIVGDSSNEVGFVWLLAIANTNEEKWFDIAVYDSYSNQRVASKALLFVESKVVELGIKKLKAIVTSNSNKGKIVRRWLYNNCFKLIDKPSVYVRIPDDEFLLKTPNPVCFEKIYS